MTDTRVLNAFVLNVPEGTDKTHKKVTINELCNDYKRLSSLLIILGFEKVGYIKFTDRSDEVLDAFIVKKSIKFNRLPTFQEYIDYLHTLKIITTMPTNVSLHTLFSLLCNLLNNCYTIFVEETNKKIQKTKNMIDYTSL